MVIAEDQLRNFDLDVFVVDLPQELVTMGL